jgi:hypothetical protein
VPDEKGLTSLESSYGEEETSRRRDAALLRALRTRQVTIESGRAAKAARRLRLSAAIRAIVSFRVLSMPHKRQREMKVGKRKSRRDAPDEPEKSSS